MIQGNFSAMKGPKPERFSGGQFCFGVETRRPRRWKAALWPGTARVGVGVLPFRELIAG